MRVVETKASKSRKFAPCPRLICRATSWESRRGGTPVCSSPFQKPILEQVVCPFYDRTNTLYCVRNFR